MWHDPVSQGIDTMCSLYVGYVYVGSYPQEAVHETVQHHLRNSGHHYGLSGKEIEDLMTVAMTETEFDPDVP
jgi:hypothetical protein